MKTFAPALSEILRAHVEEFAQDALDRSLGDPDKHRYTLEEYRQMLGGFVGMVEDAAYERTTETFDLFIDTLIPSLVRGGVDPSGHTKRLAAFCVELSCAAARELPAEINREACLWLASYLGMFVARSSAAAHDTAATL